MALWKGVWYFLTELNIESTYNSAILLLPTSPREMNENVVVDIRAQVFFVDKNLCDT